jgi:hypothetical protein
MSQAGTISSSGGGGGGGDVNSLTPDSGAPVTAIAGTIPTLGYQAGIVPTIETYNDGSGNFRIADQSWETQYVVDPSTTNGLKGTFQTIQSAINQAVSDGAAYPNNFKKIYIRTGTYTENLSIPPGIMLSGEVLSDPSGGVITPYQTTLISGNHTFTGGCVWGATGINFLAASGDMFSNNNASIVFMYMRNCLFYAASGSVGTSFPVGYLSFDQCSFLGSGNAFNFTSGTLNITKSIFSQNATIIMSGGEFIVDTTYGIGTVTLSGGALIEAVNCTFTTTTASNYNIDATATSAPGSLLNCGFSGANIAGVSASTSGAWIMQNCYTGTTNDSVNFALYSSTINLNNYGNANQGNLIKSYRTATNYQMDTLNYYVGVTSTGSAITIDLPDSSAPQRDQVFIIKDEGGGAATHNITVTTSGGVKTIDGATSKVINTNYGFLQVIYNGTNYFTF